MSIRTERVASLIKEEIGSILSREYNDPAYGFITVTDVRMTPDLKIARIAFSILGGEEKQQKGLQMLEQNKQHIRSLIASRVTLRFAPALQFELDDSLQRVDRINAIIRQIHNGDGRNGDQS